MKRSGFARKVLERKRAPLIGMKEPRGTMAPVPDVVIAQSKEVVVRSEAYRRLVARLPCDRCKIAGHTQVCHADAGKGMSIKSSDLTCYPGCGPRHNSPGCHYMIGSTGMMSRDERREYEAEAGARTRLALLVMADDDHKVRKVLESVGLLP